MRGVATGRRLIVLIGLTGLLGLSSACGQVAPSIPAPDNAAAPAASAAEASPPAAATPAVPQVSAVARATTADLGVQIYWHEVNDPAAVKQNAERLLDYVVGLGANSVAISFPIYTDGARPTRVYVTDGVTPTPDSLRSLTGEAKARGLRVMLRPLLDEKNIDDGSGAWRGTIAPRNVAAWFSSYQQTLTPFLTAAQAAHADTFVIGVELESLAGLDERWQEVVAAAAAAFSGRLAFAENYHQWAEGSSGVEGTQLGLDAYPRLGLSESATVEQIAAAWVDWLQSRPGDVSGTVVQELGIAATYGAYNRPFAWAEPGQAVVPQIQQRWFAGACQAIRSLGMAGIYFWTLDAWSDPADAASYDAGSFIGRGDSAIRDCFVQGWPGQ